MQKVKLAVKHIPKVNFEIAVRFQEYSRESGTCCTNFRFRFEYFFLIV